MNWEKFYKSQERVDGLRKSEDKKRKKGYFELSDYLPFGRYRLHTVQEMIDKNDSYFEWVKKNKVIKFHMEVEVYRKNKNYKMEYIKCKNCVYNSGKCIIGYKNKFKSGDGCAKGKRRVINEV